MVDFYIILFDAIRSNPDSVAHGREGYYFGENGEFTHLQVVNAIAKVLYAKGLTNTVTPTPFTEEEFQKLPLVSNFIFHLAHRRIIEFESATFLWYKRALSRRSLSLSWLEAG